MNVRRLTRSPRRRERAAYYPVSSRRDRTSPPAPRGCRRASSAARRAVRVHIERIERMARGHEQAVASGTAEAEICAAFGQRDEGDRLAGGIENLDPVLLGVAHAPAAPEIAVDIAAEAVGRATRFGSDEGATICELVVVDV